MPRQRRISVIGMSVSSCTERLQSMPFSVVHVKYLQRMQFILAFQHDFRKSRSVPSTGVSDHALHL